MAVRKLKIAMIGTGGRAQAHLSTIPRLADRLTLCAVCDVDPARADRSRFLRIARERGRCRMIHESHRTLAVIADNALAALRVWVARIAGAGPERLAREERRLAVAQGMLDGLRSPGRG